MSLGIEAYRAMSQSGISQLALLSNGRGQTKIVDASETKVGFLKRLFNTSASKKVNIAVTSDFKSALSRAYSTRVADEAFSAVIGKSGLTGAKLSANLVARTLGMAEKIVASRLAPPAGTAMMLTMRIEGKDEMFDLRGMFSGERETMSAAKDALTTLHDLLMDMPTDKLALDDFKKKILEAKDNADSLAKTLAGVDGAEKVVAALRKAVAMVDGKIAEATEVCNSNPITYKSLSEFAAKFIEAAKRAATGLPDSGRGYCLNGQTGERLPAAFAKLTGDGGFLNMLADSTKPNSPLLAGATKSQLAEIRKQISDYINPI